MNIKLITGLIIFTVMSGCSTTTITPIQLEVLPIEECEKVTPYWYGQQGQSPCDNNVWRCYDWEINEI